MSVAWSQEGFLPGYVITNWGDTIYGKVKDSRYANASVKWQKIEFINNKGEKTEYSTWTAKEYKRGETLFRAFPIGIDRKVMFLEMEENGPVVLYSLNHGTGWGAAGNGIGVTPKGQDHEDRVEFFLQRKNDPNSMMQWRPNDYTTTAKQFFKADTTLMREVREEKFGVGDIKKIVQLYNEWKDNH
jgi:hypothetical protein